MLDSNVVLLLVDSRVTNMAVVKKSTGRSQEIASLPQGVRQYRRRRRRVL